MKIRAIQDMRTCVDEIPPGAKGVHESTLQAYQVLERTVYWLQEGVPPKIVLELIRELRESK